MLENKELSQEQKQRLQMIKKSLNLAEKSISDAKRFIEELTGDKELAKIQFDTRKDLQDKAKSLEISTEERIIEGVFDGQNMLGPDDKMYPIPANYASKSKLVEGDILKLTIESDGTFVFKQIGPVERQKLIGVLTEDNGEFIVTAVGKKYKVLLASVTYFKADPDDEVTIIVPKDKESTWAAIENVIKQRKIGTFEETQSDLNIKTEEDIDKELGLEEI